MDRRNFLTQGAGFVAAGVAAGLSGSKAFGAAATTPTKDLATILSDCIKAGNACVAHCMTELANGNKSMGECNKTTHEMLACCEALLKLTSYGSKLTKSMAKTCAESCKLCKKACEAHKEHWAHGMHLACKACYDACVECEEACNKV